MWIIVLIFIFIIMYLIIKNTRDNYSINNITENLEPMFEEVVFLLKRIEKLAHSKLWEGEDNLSASVQISPANDEGQAFIVYNREVPSILQSACRLSVSVLELADDSYLRDLMIYDETTAWFMEEFSLYNNYFTASTKMSFFRSNWKMVLIALEKYLNENYPEFDVANDTFYISVSNITGQK